MKENVFVSSINCFPNMLLNLAIKHSMPIMKLLFSFSMKEIKHTSIRSICLDLPRGKSLLK